MEVIELVQVADTVVSSLRRHAAHRNVHYNGHDGPYHHAIDQTIVNPGSRARLLCSCRPNLRWLVSTGRRQTKHRLMYAAMAGGRPGLR